MGAAVPDTDELPPDAIMRRETHQVHAKEKQQTAQAIPPGTRNQVQSACMHGPDTIMHARHREAAWAFQILGH